MPSARRTSLRSALATGCSFSYVRFRFLDLCSSRWLCHAALRISLPVLVTRILFAKPLRVLILGTGGGLLGGALLSHLRGCRGGRLWDRLPAWSEDHVEVLAFEQGGALDDRERLRVIRHPIENPPADVLVHHLPSSEHDRHFHLLACFEELLHPFELGLEIVCRHLRAELHLLELDDVLLAPLVLLLLYGLELEASVVHQPGDRRLRLRRHLDEVEPLLAGNAQSGIEGYNPELVVLVIDQPHFGAADLIVDP